MTAPASELRPSRSSSSASHLVPVGVSGRGEGFGLATERFDVAAVRAVHGQLVGREALIAELDRLLFHAAEPRAWVVLVGGPGRGKSAILSHYAARLERGEIGSAPSATSASGPQAGAGEPAKKKLGFIDRLLGRGRDSSPATPRSPSRTPGRPTPHAYVAIRREVLGGAFPDALAAALLAQLEARFPELREPSPEPELALGELLERISSRVLVPQSQRLVLVIDALDELEGAELGEPLARLLPESLPAGVSVLCGARPDAGPLGWLRTREPAPITIDLDGTEWRACNQEAATRFWQLRAAEASPRLPDAVARELAELAEGNLLHAALAHAGLSAAGGLKDGRVPRGLSALVAHWLDTLNRGPAVARRGLALLAAAQAGLSTEHLSLLLGSSGTEFVRVCRAGLWPLPGGAPTAVLDDPLVRYSIPGALRAQVQAWLGPEAIVAAHRQLAAQLCSWPLDERTEQDPWLLHYALRQGLWHRAQGGDPAAARRLARQVGFLVAAAEVCGAGALCAELARVGEDDLHRALRRELAWLLKNPAALPGLLYNRLICLGWTPARLRDELTWPQGLPTVRLRFPLQQDGSACERLVQCRPATGLGDENEAPSALQALALWPEARDGSQRALLGGGDGTLQLWRIGPGPVAQELWSCRGHAGPVHALALSPVGSAGTVAASAGADGLVKLWALDRDGGRELQALRGHAGSVRSVAFLDGGKRVVSGGSDGVLRLWDAATGQPLRMLRDGQGAIHALALLPDGRLATAADDRVVKLWDLESGVVVRTLAGHSAPVRSLLPVPGGLLVSASLDSTLKIWQPADGSELRTLRGHADSVLACTLAGAGTPSARLISASLDGTLRVWDLASGALRGELVGHQGAVTGCAPLPATQGQGAKLLSTALDGTLRVWDLAIAERLHALAGHTSFVTALALTPDRQRLISASRDRTLKVWRTSDGCQLQTLSGHAASVDECVVLPDGERVVSASYDATLKVWELGRQQALRTLQGHSGWVSGCASLFDGNRVVSAAMDGTLRVWDTRTGQALRSLVGHTDSITACAVLPRRPDASGDGSERVVSASADGTLRVWQLATGAQLLALHGHAASVDRCAVLPPDPRDPTGTERVVSASADGTLKVWNVQTGAHLQTLSGHANWVSACAPLPDGQRVLSASGDGTLKVWDLATGTALRTLVGHQAAIYNCALLDEGRRAVSVSGDGQLKLWELDTGACLWTVCGVAGAGFFSVQTSPGWIYAGDVVGNVWMLEVDPA